MSVRAQIVSAETQLDVVYFGPFRLDRARRLLEKEGRPLHVRTREIDLLVLLVDRAGAFVTSAEIVAHIWPGQVVEDSNVRVQIGALRRVLGEGRESKSYIVSVAGKGYSFCAPVARESEINDDVVEPTVPEFQHNLPNRVKSTVGRAEAAFRLISRVPQQRLATITGPGGIGKTTLVLSAGKDLLDGYDDGVRFVDLATLSDPALVTSAIMSALGLPVASNCPDEDLIRHVESRQMLFILDNCEHLIEAVASLVERVLTSTRDVSFLTTSREPLRIDGEWLFRLGPLDVPPRKTGLTANEALAYPAVQLFVERAQVVDSTFVLTDDDAAPVADLCRRLDGNPLALELAAARLTIFGIERLVARLDESFNVLTQGRRNALPRHQTLRATLDWSYEILSPREKSVLRRLSVFRGEFTLAMALAVASCDGDLEYDSLDAMAELTSKSLINADVTTQPEQYRLLFLTRDYAYEKLRESGEMNKVHQRHAAEYLNLLQASDSLTKDGNAARWIDDIRGALSWAYSVEGDPDLAVQLTAEAVEIGMRLSLYNEFGNLIDRALKQVDDAEALAPALVFRLFADRMHMLLHTDNSDEVVRSLSRRALSYADAMEGANDDATRSELISLVFAAEFGVGDGPRALEVAERAETLAQIYAGDEAAHASALRMRAQAEHFAGQHAQALSAINTVLDIPLDAVQKRNLFLSDRLNPHITLRITLARIRWMQGFPEEADRIAREAMAMAAGEYVNVPCYILSFSLIPIAFWRGRLREARDYVRDLSDRATKFGLSYWEQWARIYERALFLHDQRLPPSETPFEVFEELEPNALQVDIVGTLMEGLISASALTRVDVNAVGWCAPETLRAHAVTEMQRGNMTSDVGEGFLLRALEVAKSQGALGWELRVATSLARLWRYQPGRDVEAIALLEDVIGRFTEGFDDNDMLAAEAVLRQLEVAQRRH